MCAGLHRGEDLNRTGMGGQSEHRGCRSMGGSGVYGNAERSVWGILWDGGANWDWDIAGHACWEPFKGLFSLVMDHSL